MLDTEGSLEQYRQLDAQALLMYRSETDPIFTDCAEALHAVLPHSTLLRPPGLNHDSAQTYGKPETIAAALRLFFGQMNDLTAMARNREEAAHGAVRRGRVGHPSARSSPLRLDPPARAGMPSCVARRVTKPIRNREASIIEPT